MSGSYQNNFVMSIDGEDQFEVDRFGYDPAGFHVSTVGDTDSDSNNQNFLSLQSMCKAIERRKTMLFIKRSDLVTVKLAETYLQKKSLDHIMFVVTQTANGTRTTTWVAALNLKDVSIVDLKTRIPAGFFPGGKRLLIDVVSLRINGAFERNYDPQGRPETTDEEERALNNR